MTHHVKTVDLARGKWRGILLQLGLSDSFLKNKHGPCPCCGGKDRYRWDDKNGNGSAICSNCGSWKTGLDLLMDIRGWDFRTAAGEVDRIVGTVKAEPKREMMTDAEKRDRMRKLWMSSQPIQKGDPVDLYLSGRGLGEVVYPKTLRFVPECYYAPNTFHPAMIALVEDQNGDAKNIHRTYLTQDGRKLPVDDPRKMMPGTLPHGSCVRLTEASGRIGVAEGIETAMAASGLYTLPVWACINATLLQNWVPPVGVDHVTVFGDNDASFTGQAAAYALAKRLKAKGLTASVSIPTVMDTDWADEIRSEVAA